MYMYICIYIYIRYSYIWQVRTICHHWFGRDIPIVFCDCKLSVVMQVCLYVFVCVFVSECVRICGRYNMYLQLFCTCMSVDICKLGRMNHYACGTTHSHVWHDWCMCVPRFIGINIPWSAKSFLNQIALKHVKRRINKTQLFHGVTGLSHKDLYSADFMI